jgi:hypothetical protein
MPPNLRRVRPGLAPVNPKPADEKMDKAKE